MNPFHIEAFNHALIFDSILALKDHQADEREEMAEDLRKIREDIISGKDDRDFSE